MQVLELDPAQVFVGDRLRAVDASEAEKLAVSMRERGQLSPVHVGPMMEDGRYPLIAGAHRLAAVFKAGLPTVAALVFASEADEARLHEIDENLYRHELTPYDQAAFLAERREIFERVNGRVAAGRKAKPDNRAKLARFPAAQMSFWDDTTKKFGIPERTLKRALRRRAKIASDVWQALRGTAVASIGSEIDALAQIKEHAVQRDIVKLMKQRGCTIRAAIAVVRPARVSTSSRDTFQQLTALWGRSGNQSRREFIAFLHRSGDDDLDDLVVGLIEDALAKVDPTAAARK